MSEAIDKRLETLAPFVSGLSAYVQRLVWLDLNRGLLREDGSINEAAVLTVKDPAASERRGRSFNQSHNATTTPDAGVDNASGTVHNGAAGCVGVVAQLVEHHNGIVSSPEFPPMIVPDFRGFSRPEINRDLPYTVSDSTEELAGNSPRLNAGKGGILCATHELYLHPLPEVEFHSAPAAVFPLQDCSHRRAA
jgi:hypothetical protein